MSATRPVLEAVVFDAGGTLVRLDFEWMAEAVTELGAPLEAERLRRAEVQGRRRYDASARPETAAAADGSGSPTSAAPAESLGTAGDIKAYFSGMLEAAGVPSGMIEPAMRRFLVRERDHGLWMRPMEGARAAIDAIAALGLRRAVVSNSDGRAESHLDHSDVLRGIEHVVDSHKVQVEKPDPRIFGFALEFLGVRPERALYVGDIRSVDERGARRAGMHFVLIDPYGDYGEPGGPAIPSMDRLAAWVQERFDVIRAVDGARR